MGLCGRQHEGENRIPFVTVRSRSAHLLSGAIEKVAKVLDCPHRQGFEAVH